MNKIKIYAVDDHQLIVNGLKDIIEDTPQMNWVGSANGGKELLIDLKHINPDIIILDLNMPDMDGFDIIPILKKNYPKIKILVISMYDDNSIVRKVIKMGVNGFVPKNANPEELSGALLNIASGQQYFSPILMQAFIGVSSPATDDTSTFSKMNLLSKRELEILQMVVEGMSNIEIAEKLFISKRTVDAHRSNFMQKLELSSVVDLVKFALHHKIV